MDFVGNDVRMFGIRGDLRTSTLELGMLYDTVNIWGSRFMAISVLISISISKVRGGDGTGDGLWGKRKSEEERGGRDGQACACGCNLSDRRTPSCFSAQHLGVRRSCVEDV